MKKIKLIQEVRNMKLNKDEKKAVKQINAEQYTVETVEKYWKENPLSLATSRIPVSYTVLKVREINAFMTAVHGLMPKPKKKKQKDCVKSDKQKGNSAQKTRKKR